MLAVLFLSRNCYPRLYTGIEVQRGCDSREARQIGKEMLKSLGELSGIFLERGQDEHGKPVYGFLHQTFGEYLAGIHMAEALQAEQFDLGKYIHRSVWHEPLLLMAGHLSIYSTPQANTLIEDILRFDSLYEDVLQRDSLLALDCLADDIRVKPELRQEALNRLALMLAHDAPQVRESAVTQCRRLAITSHRSVILATIKQTYPIGNNAEMAKFTPEIRLGIIEALIYLGDRDGAQPLLWSLKNTQGKAQRLRLEYWPEEAVDYMLSLKADPNTYFSVFIGSDLAECRIGPVNAQLLYRVLGIDEFKNMINKLKSHVKDKSELAILDWIALLAKNPADNSLFKQFIERNDLPQAKRLAAERLLEDELYTGVAIRALQELVNDGTDEAPAAARLLLRKNVEHAFNWKRLQELSLLVNDSNAPKAIETLMENGFENFAVPAGLFLLSNSHPENISYNNIWDVANCLFRWDPSGLGRTTMEWLATRLGYPRRLQASQALLDAGYIKETIPLLEMIAYAHFDEDRQKACQQLLLLKELESIAPLLQAMAKTQSSKSRYYAHMAFALLDKPSNAGKEATKIQSKPLNLDGQLAEYHRALIDFCSNGLDVLNNLTPENEFQRSTILLAKCSLYQQIRNHGLEDVETILSANDFHTNTWRQLLQDPEPVIMLQCAFFVPLEEFTLFQERIISMWQHHQIELSIPLKIACIQILSRQINVKQGFPVLIQALSNEDGSVRSEAVSALGQVGDESTIPHLLNALSDGDSSVRNAAVSALGNVGDESVISHLFNALSDEDSSVRNAAVSALGNVGDESVISHLLNALSDGDSSVRNAAVSALGNVGDESIISHLLTFVSDEDSSVRREAVYILERVGNESIIPHLLTLLSDENESVRRASAYVLRRVGDESIVPYLLTALSDKESTVRNGAAFALGQVGDESVIPSLLAVLSDEDGSVRSAAVSALGAVGDESVIPSLLAVLSDEDGSVRSAAVSALGRVGDESIVPYLLTALSDKESSVRNGAAFALGQVGDESVISYLRAVLSDGVSYVRYSAAFALGQVGDESVIPHLLLILAHESGYIPGGAVYALGAVGNESVIPHLLIALSNKDDYVRSGAAYALGQVGDKSVIPHLLKALTDKDSSVRSGAAYALGQVGDESVISHLLIALSDKDSSVRRRAAYALGRVGDESVIPDLLKALNEKNSWTQAEIFYALGHLGAIEATQYLSILKPSDMYEVASIATAAIHLDPELATIFLDEYTQKYPRNSRISTLKGQTLWQKDDLPAALSHFQNGILINKKKQRQFIGLGSLSFGIG